MFLHDSSLTETPSGLHIGMEQTGVFSSPGPNNEIIDSILSYEQMFEASPSLSSEMVSFGRFDTGDLSDRAADRAEMFHAYGFFDTSMRPVYLTAIGKLSRITTSNTIASTC